MSSRWCFFVCEPVVWYVGISNTKGLSLAKAKGAMWDTSKFDPSFEGHKFGVGEQSAAGI